MIGDFLLLLVVSLSLLASVGAQSRPPELEVRVSSQSVETDSIDIMWTLLGDNEAIEQVFINASYAGPCTSVRLPPKAVVLNQPQSDMYTITELQQFSDYQVNVTVVTIGGVASGIGTFITKGDAPSSLATLRVQSATTTNLTLTWTPIPCLDLNSRLEEYTLTITPFNPALGGPLRFGIPATSTAYTITNLMPASQYTVKLNATYTISDFTTIDSCIAAPINASTFSIPGPYSLSATDIQTNAITISWQQESPTDNLTGYQVAARYLGPCSSVQNDQMEGVPITTEFHMFQNLTEFGMYDVSVTAVSTTNQNASSSISVQTLPTAPSAPPSAVRILSLQAFMLTLTWEAIECEESRSEIVSYIVNIAPSANESEIRNISGLTNTTVTITDLISTTMYSIQVRAVNREGLHSPSSPLTVITPAPPPPPQDLVVVSAQATAVTLSWTALPGLAYTIVATYLGPCTNAIVPRRNITVQSGRGNVIELEEFSYYSATVTPQGGRQASSVNFTTLAADPSPADDHVQLISSTNTSVVLRAPPIDCIHQNGLISEFRLRYAKTDDFLRGVNVRNGLFTPGLVIVGNLEPGTQYVFQLRIVTQEGGNVTLQPLRASTTGVSSETTPLPTDVPTTSRPNTDTIITTVILVVGIIVLTAMTATVLACITWRRRGHRVQRSDKEKLIRKEEGIGVQNQFSDIENVECNPFGRQLSAPASDDQEWEKFGSSSRPMGVIEFSKKDWMSAGLGTNPISAIYADGDVDLDEDVFELAPDKTKYDIAKSNI